MEITSLKPLKDRTALELIISDAAGATSLILFTNKTYKDYNQAIDLTSKLTGAASQTITIGLADLKQPYLDGLYFIQLEDTTDICTAITLDDTRYRECILNEIIKMDTCDDCIIKATDPIVTKETLLKGLHLATNDGFVEQAFNIVNSLDKYCSDSCATCGDLNNVATTDYFTSNSN